MKPKSKSCKKNQAKNCTNGSTTEESSSEEEPQPCKRKKTTLEEEEVSLASDGSELEEPEVIGVMDLSNRDETCTVGDADDMEIMDVSEVRLFSPLSHSDMIGT